MVPDVVIMCSFWGIVFHIRNLILLGVTTKKRYSLDLTKLVFPWPLCSCKVIWLTLCMRLTFRHVSMPFYKLSQPPCFDTSHILTSLSRETNRGYIASWGHSFLSGAFTQTNRSAVVKFMQELPLTAATPGNTQ